MKAMAERGSQAFTRLILILSAYVTAAVVVLFGTLVLGGGAQGLSAFLGAAVGVVAILLPGGVAAAVVLTVLATRAVRRRLLAIAIAVSIVTPIAWLVTASYMNGVDVGPYAGHPELDYRPSIPPLFAFVASVAGVVEGIAAAIIAGRSHVADIER